MKIHRCAVVHSDDACETSSKVLQALSQCGDIEAFSCTQTPTSDTLVSSVVIVCDGAELSGTLDQIGTLRSLTPMVAILVVVIDAKTENLNALIAAGVFDFVSPQLIAEELLVRLRRAIGALPVSQPNLHPAPGQPPIRGLVYTSKACASVAAKIPLMAGCDSNVLILGETGTGKEVCAHAIHYLSQRSPNPWIAVNCGAIPAELVEAELFGHTKGAYTTAHAARAGLVREAESGTLFLDDIDCLPLPAQAKLLRFLQEREYRQVGSNAVQHADVRVIAASNCDLNAMVQQGAFRHDLYYRLNVLRLDLPTLRDRPEDIAVLVPHFVSGFARDFQRPVRSLSPGAIVKLLAHDWPGNVRELKHVIERAVLLSSGPTLQADDIQIDCAHAHERRNDSFQSAKSRVVEKFERNYLERVLVAHSGNVTHAAKAAQKDRRAFFELMRKHDMAPQNYRVAPLS